MKKIFEQTLAESISNGENGHQTVNLSPTMFDTRSNLTKPAELLMNFILPTMTNRLKDRQEIMKIKEGNTENVG